MSTDRGHVFLLKDKEDIRIGLDVVCRLFFLIVLDCGQVVEQGSHDELMAREGAYFRLYEAQARHMNADIDDKE